jgi:hypothetical protein
MHAYPLGEFHDNFFTSFQPDSSSQAGYGFFSTFFMLLGQGFHRLNISYWSVSLLFFLVGLAMYVFL